MTWTEFDDDHSGGGTKVDDFELIYIEEKEEVARVIFFNRFGRNPDKVTSTCCGSDYSVSEEEELNDFFHFSEYGQTWHGRKEESEVLIIPSSEIKDEERVGEVPEQGYVWVG